MGKVYDALRRAEEQRARQQGETAAAPSPGAGPSAPPAATGAPRKKRLWDRARELAAPLAPGTDAGTLNKRRIALLQPESFVAEQFRTLRARIDSIAASHPEHPIRTVAVTSAMRGDGKTTSAIGLASVTAMALGRKVLLMDADLRAPAVAAALGLRPTAGLAEVLSGDTMPEEAILGVEGTELEVLPVRALPRNPAELLGSAAMRELLTHLAGRYDRIVLDLPPTLGLPDAKVVSELCDGIVFVVRANHTPRSDVSDAIELLDRRRILGLLLNGAEEHEARYGYRAG